MHRIGHRDELLPHIIALIIAVTLAGILINVVFR